MIRGIGNGASASPLAVVGGNEVANHFEVAEVYVSVDGVWKLASLSFTWLLR